MFTWIVAPQQQGLFGSLEPEPKRAAALAPADVGDDVRATAASLPAGLRFGTSSWNFPGWRGVVYAPESAKSRLSRDGLAPYSRHPLLRAVGLDRTFYAPIDTADFAAYAGQVPADFRFLVKVWGEVTSPTVRGQSGKNARYLDFDTTVDSVIAPAVEGLGNKLGPLLFQFPPQGRTITREPDAFAERVAALLERLPTGVDYTIELRDTELLTERYVDVITAAGAQHCYSVHPRMPALARQLELAPLRPGSGHAVTVRWMLHHGFEYETAKARYTPFDRLVDEDPDSRAAIADLCEDALGLELPVTVIVNNKAEGSAPLSIVALAEAIRSRRVET